MSAPLSLPLPTEALPEPVRRFANPDTPEAARMMAARGLVPVRGAELVTLLAQLSHDPAAAVADTARSALWDLPPNVMQDACGRALPAAVIHYLASSTEADEPLLTVLVTNDGASNETVRAVAEQASEALCERIAINERRLLEAPQIIEALYLNRHMRMSTADRLVNLARRNGLELKGLPTFAAHADSLQELAAPDASDVDLELPSVDAGALFGGMPETAGGADAGDEYFLNTLNALDDFDDEVEAEETKRKPLRNQIREMTISQKLRLTMLGNAAARAILVRDTNRLVSMSAIASPRMTIDEVAKFAKSREVGDEVLNQIARRRDWLRSYDVKRSLVFNPKSAQTTAMSLVSHMRDADLRDLSRSRDVAPAVRNAAKRRLQKKTQKK